MCFDALFYMFSLDCEKVTQRFLSYIIDKKPLPAEYSDPYKLLKYSGTGINDLGDYYSCNVLSFGKFYRIDIQLGGTSQSIGLCYLKQCNKQYTQTALYKVYDNISKFVLIIYLKESLVLVDPDKLIKDVRQRHLLGFCFIVSILLILVAIVLYSKFFTS